ncbi:LruC domain-containing protein [Maribellus maritimus]|uniref:LruC domain-containing protein n=1 Tax=Maribellus maritimus TaxID=2870838 RepID=UPI001EEB1CD2|nr:LruC domain-containing protein [Maribellus maritimus]MCG6187882.1 LruC domain-containing protein [Maribellus maritimus]
MDNTNYRKQPQKRMKERFYILPILLTLIVSFSSCLKEPDEIVTNPESKKTMDNLNVSEDFSWKTSKTVTLVINAISDNPELNSKVSVYNGNPESGGKLIINCGLNEETTFENEIQIPTYISTLYLKCEFPSGNSAIDSVSTRNIIDYTFTESSATKSAAILSAEAPNSPGCAGDVSITATSGGITVENDKIYVITGNYIGDVTFQNGGGTLRICGNVTLRNTNFNGNLSTVAIEVTSSGSLTTSNLNLNSSNYKLSNWGTFNYPNQFSPNGIINNFGTANISGLNINSGGTLLNTGSLNISGNFNNNASSENNGAMSVSGHFNNNGTSEFTNNCKLIVTGNFAQNSTLENSGYISCGGTFTINSSNSTTMTAGAMIKTVNLTVNDEINGIGDYSSLSVSSTTHINGGGALTGNIDICDEGGIEVNNGTIASTVTYCQNYIAKSDCNPVGIGEAPTSDSDGDGVPDGQDDYPDDPNTSYNSYFPNETDSATLVFEDLWPSKGDYDFNDLVVYVKGKYATNSNNKVVKVVLDFKVKAVGASNMNGLGIQFDDVASSEVTSVSGAVKNSASGISLNNNGTEAGQSKAVIIAIENVNDVLNRTGGSMFNTVKNGHIGTSDLVTITVSFENKPISLDKINSAGFNFFLIKNQERGTEIHLADRKPTDLMTYEFGASDDTSVPGSGRLYKTSNNLPWGLLILEPFDYPMEKIEITDAYSNFASWAESNGTMHADWYKNPNSSKVW